ncbi:MAG TPA: methyltransferase domain-containing protein [Candidatus Saccharimonadales bacterium]|nr:methyltransferase domain-containing protein [Candidatus Saccharimonadales bacterium]
MPDVDLATADGQDRYVPTETRDITSAGHEGVYEWIAENLVKEGTRALDFGCGTGYGAALMAKAGATVDGIDSSPAAIGYATDHYAGLGIRFFVADLVKPLPDAFTPRSYDLVASSEVLEHVVDPFAFVRGMAASLNDSGVCFVGTPNRQWSIDHVPDGHLLARSHMMEFTPPALIALLRTAFDEVSLMVRVFPEGAMNTVPPPTEAQPSPAQHPRPQVIRVSAALLRKVAPGAVERIKRAVEPTRPSVPAVPAQPAPQEWLASDIVWAKADDPTVDMERAVGLAAVCRRPRRVRRRKD